MLYIADERLIKNLSEKLNEMIESKAQLNKKLILLQKELDAYRSQQANSSGYFETEHESENSRIIINDYSKASKNNT